MDHSSLPSIADLAWVEYVFWPSQQNLRSCYANIGVARLLLVVGDAPIPDALHDDEDWIRIPAAAIDIRACAERLAKTPRHHADDPPYIDDGRLLHRGPIVVPLSRVQADLLTVLLERPDVVITRSELAQRVWRTSSPSDAAVDAAVHRLRRRVMRARLSIRAVRGRGVMVHVS